MIGGNLFSLFCFTYDKLNKTMDYKNMESRKGYYCRWYSWGIN